MPHNFSAAKLQSRLLVAARKAVDEVTIAYQGELRKVLSRPGTGRYYARNARTRKIAGKRRFGELSYWDVKEINRRDAQRIRASLKSGRNIKVKSLRDLGVHQASAPGHPPAVDSGRLRQSWQTGPWNRKSRIVGSNPGVRLGTTVKYARALEYGYGKLKARPSIKVAKKMLFTGRRVQRIVQHHVRAALTKGPR